MMVLATLIPCPIQIETDFIAGKLRINGNIEHNVIQFRFRFAKGFETAPVCLKVYSEGKTYRYYCTILKKATKEMITPIFTPEFAVGQCFRVTGIDPIVHFFIETPRIGFQIDN